MKILEKEITQRNKEHVTKTELRKHFSFVIDKMKLDKNSVLELESIRVLKQKLLKIIADARDGYDAINKLEADGVNLSVVYLMNMTKEEKKALGAGLSIFKSYAIRKAVEYFNSVKHYPIFITHAINFANGEEFAFVESKIYTIKRNLMLKQRGLFDTFVDNFLHDVVEKQGLDIDKAINDNKRAFEILNAYGITKGVLNLENASMEEITKTLKARIWDECTISDETGLKVINSEIARLTNTYGIEIKEEDLLVVDEVNDMHVTIIGMALIIDYLKKHTDSPSYYLHIAQLIGLETKEKEVN